MAEYKFMAAAAEEARENVFLFPFLSFFARCLNPRSKQSWVNVERETVGFCVCSVRVCGQ